MTLSEELRWRGFVNQTTYKDISVLDGEPISFYWGVDPSADSMTIGHLAMAMMVRHFIAHGHRAYLLVGGATGLIGDPDGKTQERDLRSAEEVDRNKQAIAEQYQAIFSNQPFTTVDNYDWFKGVGYLEFLRTVGKHVPMRQMLGREFVQSRLGEDGAGISYAEFSYALIQGYDFLYLYTQHGVTLQVCGADQWGNSVAGVDLIRRIENGEAHVWSAPLVINKTTGVKFGKSEAGAVWLNPAKTSHYQFYQFWLNVDDASVEDYLKIFTLLSPDEIKRVMAEFANDRRGRAAQKTLAHETTKLIHGQLQADRQARIADALSGQDVSSLSGDEVSVLRSEMPALTMPAGSSVVVALVDSNLAASNTEALRLIKDNAISINGRKIDREAFTDGDFSNGRLLLRRGKAYKDSALIELA